ncbi:hypothetical protein AR457_37345 [Streptomyces agglomeratus]|uniref:Uncharacterized protein n=1 Tax=Streptomyces agglomeratus TaxID=285458 RepID=A0A1E5NYS0_9ACTN|nr:hypothetical protein AS594_38575 [Streptomyces agglomeratus]OEJ22896.1 hypothetical protein AR457_37345 [Streptomyces agglomeratus]OEJ36474.1 hypothetical protein BGK72_37840 [Streptomyces agglomeratus]
MSKWPAPRFEMKPLGLPIGQELATPQEATQSCISSQPSRGVSGRRSYVLPSTRHQGKKGATTWITTEPVRLVRAPRTLSAKDFEHLWPG